MRGHLDSLVETELEIALREALSSGVVANEWIGSDDRRRRASG